MNKVISHEIRRPYQELCREKAKEALVNDILIDLNVCKIEGWCHKEYIKQLKNLIDGIHKQICKE